MPLLRIQTNLALDTAALRELPQLASRRVAELLGKPERYVMVSLEHNPAMLFAGTDAPLAYLELKSIGLPAARTGELSKALCELVGQQLGVAQDRIYIEFANAPGNLWGWDGGTF
jgi:phenylpyruvate tautomerase PptA (4-oxalocrotonate tautomerase family)